MDSENHDSWDYRKSVTKRITVYTSPVLLPCKDKMKSCWMNPRFPQQTLGRVGTWVGEMQTVQVGILRGLGDGEVQGDRRYRCDTRNAHLNQRGTVSSLNTATPQRGGKICINYKVHWPKWLRVEPRGPSLLLSRTELSHSTAVHDTS